MNICIFGVGDQQGKFGYDFCQRARSQGHDVTAFSHRPTGDNIVIDYNNISRVVEKFESVVATKKIDLVLYNATAGGYADDPDHFTGNHTVTSSNWLQAIRVPVIVPHAIATTAQRYMPAGSAMVFMGSGLARDMNRTEYTNLVGYAGGKAVQTHLMLALAHNNTNQMIFHSIFPYFGQPSYSSVCDKIYNHLTNITPAWNGKIFEVYN